MIKNDILETTKIFFSDVSNQLKNEDAGLKEIFDYFIKSSASLNSEMFNQILQYSNLFPYDGYISRDYLKMNKIKFLNIAYNDFNNKFEIINDDNRVYQSIHIAISIKEKAFLFLQNSIKTNNGTFSKEEYDNLFLNFKEVFIDKILTLQKKYIEDLINEKDSNKSASSNKNGNIPSWLLDDQKEKKIDDSEFDFARRQKRLFSIFRLEKMFPSTTSKLKVKDKKNFVFEIQNIQDIIASYIDKENVYEITNFLNALGIFNRDVLVFKKNIMIDKFYHQFNRTFLKELAKHFNFSIATYSLLLNSANDIPENDLITIWSEIKKYAFERNSFDELLSEKSLKSLANNVMSTFNYDLLIFLLNDKDLNIKKLDYYYHIADNSFSVSNNNFRNISTSTFSKKGYDNYVFLKKILNSKYTNKIDVHIVWLSYLSLSNWNLYKDLIEYKNVDCIEPVDFDEEDNWIAKIMSAETNNGIVYLPYFVEFQNKILSLKDFILKHGKTIQLDKTNKKYYQINNQLASETKSNFIR